MRDNSTRINSKTQAPLAAAVKEEFPEVEYATRFLFSEFNVKYRDKIFTETATFTDPDFFKMFSFNLHIGNPDQVLRDKNTVVLSKRTAKKYFGKDNPIGKQLTLMQSGGHYIFTVNGVIEDTPNNSSIHYDLLCPFEKTRDIYREDFSIDSWSLHAVHTYIQLYNSYQMQALNSKIPSLVKKYNDDTQTDYSLQPLSDIHFASTVQATMVPASSKTYSYILAGITLLILIIASINSMNIMASLSSMRYKEVGIRKVMGAFRRQIIIQFCCETMIITAISFFLGIFLAELFLPVFNNLADKTLILTDVHPSYFIGLAIFLILGLSLPSGLFPALMLSKYQPADLYQQKILSSSKGYFSKSLIVIQFGLSIFLIVCTLVMSNQLNYLKSQNLGFNGEQVVAIPFHGGNSQQTLDTYRTTLKPYTSVINVTGAIAYPGSYFHIANVLSENASVSARNLKIDYDFLDTFGIRLSEGRNFSRNIHTDTSKAIIVNQAFVNRMDWSSAIGKTVVIEWMGWDLEVIGVINNFHYASLHEKIGPLVLFLDPYVPLNYYFVKIKPEKISETISLLKDKFYQIVPDHPFEYSFLDQSFNQLYNFEERWNQIVKYSSVLAILIAGFGLFGLSALRMTKRTKEIGIRKVAGASVSSVILMLSKEFFKWVVLANLIAWPIAYIMMDRWLQNFAYKTDIYWWIFLIAGATAILITWVTISTHAIKVALTNPVDSLRYE